MKRLFILSVFCLTKNLLCGQNAALETASVLQFSAPAPIVDSSACYLDRFKQKKYAPAVVGASAVWIGGSTYFLMKNLWWGDKLSRFHFDFNRDYKYANNLDKFGHFMGGVWAADFYNEVFKTLTYSDKKAAWYAFGMAAGIQMAIEIKDGFAPNWGFSLGDVVTGSLGGLLYVGRQHSAWLRHTDFKMSYWQYSTKYFDDRGWERRWFDPDDYINQTYWLSTSCDYLTGHQWSWMPDWLNISVGFGIEAETWNLNKMGEGGRWEIYLSPDINLEKLLKPKRKFWKKTVHLLNYVKFPMPSLRLTPYLKGYGVYF